MNERGFSFNAGPLGQSSGGPFASGAYLNGNRKLEIHYRWSLGLVTYHFGKTSIDHESYMRVLLGEKGGNRYPGFSDEPLCAFEDLAYDLKNFATAFLSGDFEGFQRSAIAAEEWKKIPGITRLP
ncbi:MAG: hypothetical protein ACRD36_00460 [Candidatus Acidiferrum sp.]